MYNECRISFIAVEIFDLKESNFFCCYFIFGLFFFPPHAGFMPPPVPPPVVPPPTIPPVVPTCEFSTLKIMC